MHTRIACLLVLLIFGHAATSEAAGPRLVRIIWDVGTNFVYMKTEPRAAIGADSFGVPKDGTAAQHAGFQVLRNGERLLRKGDRVRLYVVNYNPVSHVWHESSTFEQVAQEPSLVGPILNALVMAVTGVGKLPSGGVNPQWMMVESLTTPLGGCSVPDPVADALSKLQAAARALAEQADRVLKAATEKELNRAAKRLGSIPTDAELWRIFDNQSAWQKISPLDFDAIEAYVSAAVKELDTRVTAANAAAVAFDLALNDNPMSTACRNEARNVVLQRENAVSIIRQVAGDGTPVRDVVTKLQTSGALWATYKRKLQPATGWTADAIEIVLKDAVAADNVLRVDAVFVSPEKTVAERTQRSVVLGVEPFVPNLIITAGIAVNWFEFKTLRLEKAAVAADNTLTIKDRLVIADADSWSQLAPVWLENIKIVRYRSVGVYGTFGTTPDRNIFKNIIYGGSVGVPRWRTLFTLGQIRATGYTEEDLTPTKLSFTDPDGFSSKDLTMTNLPLAKAPWHGSWFVSASFVLASF